jgi:hypothetical protein
VILCFVYTAVWKQSPNAGGYDATDLSIQEPDIEDVIRGLQAR